MSGMSGSIPNPMKGSMSDRPVASPQLAEADRFDIEIAPLLEGEMKKVHSRSRCQTCGIVAQTIILVCMGLTVIAGVIVIDYRFQQLDIQLSSIAETGELARPLIANAENLTDDLKNLTAGLGGSLGDSLGLGDLTGNGSIADSAQNFTSNLVDAGQSIFDNLRTGFQNLGDQIQQGISDIGQPSNSTSGSGSGSASPAPSPAPAPSPSDANADLFGPSGSG